jgi:hypothetical protein
MVFLNQYATMQNEVEEIKSSSQLLNTYPQMCLHQSTKDDFQNKFRSSFSDYALAV